MARRATRLAGGWQLLNAGLLLLCWQWYHRFWRYRWWGRGRLGWWKSRWWTRICCWHPEFRKIWQRHLELQCGHACSSEELSQNAKQAACTLEASLCLTR
jgi:hypothetical protein